MNSKKIIMIGMTVGLFVGGYIPALWGEGAFSITSIFFSAIGGFIGVWVAFKLTQ